MQLRVGDVGTVRRTWGMSSGRTCCPGCGRFLKRGATACHCGLQFSYLTSEHVQVVGRARP